jgi:uncharacterized membrane protein
MASDSPPARRIFIAGLLSAVPIWITWLVISFLFRTLSAIGNPLVQWIASQAKPRFPKVEAVLSSDAFSATVSVLLVVILIYGLGILTTVVAGRKLWEFIEALLNRVPVVKHIYRSVKKLTTVLQEKPGDGVQRVVLIDFPSSEMKTVGLVTRVFSDSNTGRKLAAVYVPTTPNPTSGYLEIVPVDRLTPTSWTMDEAMHFIVSGGAVAPDHIVYDIPAADAVPDGTRHEL